MTKWRMAQKLYLGLVFPILAGCVADVDDNGSNGSDDVKYLLSSTERKGLVFTREEEKLARDVYKALEQYDMSFINIGASEQTHMDSVAVLLTKYGIEDPVEDNTVGEFTDPTLRTLYSTLVEKGLRSVQDALAVGVEIEELDIYDIEEARNHVTHDDILDTYDNLTRGSRNHLRTFYEKLVSVGGSYSPNHLDTNEFQTIVDSPMERGR